MAERYFPFNSISGDREYYAEDFAAYFGDIISSGVSANGDNLPVTAADGLTLSVGTGFAWVEGHLYQNTATKSLSLTAGGSLPRIDRVVVRLKATERKIEALVLRGTEESSPTPPPLVRNADFWDICLANINVPASAISITNSDVEDTRTDVAVCGVVRCAVNNLDVGVFMKNCEADFRAWFANLKYVLDGDVAANLQSQIDSQLDSILTTRTTSVEKPLTPFNFADIPTLKATEREDITGTASTRTITISCSTHLTATGTKIADHALMFKGTLKNPVSPMYIDPSSAAVWTNALDTAKTVTIDAKTYKLITPLQIRASISSVSSINTTNVMIQAMTKVGTASPSWQPILVDFFTGSIPEIQFRYTLDVPLQDSNLTAAQGIRMDASQIAYKDTSLQAMLEQLEALLPG